MEKRPEDDRDENIRPSAPERAPGDAPGLISVPEGHRSGYVAIIGEPNVGKSTLMNALVGRKLSIVTSKPQTTRHRILGILSEDAYQIVFLDTPGIIEPMYKLQEAMMGTVENVIDEADLLVFMADATEDGPARFALARTREKPSILVINKMDIVEDEKAFPLTSAYLGLRKFEAVIPISAKTGFNLSRLRNEIIDRLPEGPPFFPKDVVSEHPERFFISEIIREKIFERFRKEIPYSTQVNIAAYEERPDRKDLIHAEIVVERSSQKGILIGKGGSALKRIGIEARKDIEDFIGREVFLELFVKVREDWRKKDSFLRSFGYSQ